MKKTLTFIKAFDHFTTEDERIKHAFLYHSGEVVEEDEVYVRIRSSYSEFHPKVDGGEADWKLDLYNVLKAVIVARKDVEVEWDEEEEGSHEEETQAI